MCCLCVRQYTFSSQVISTYNIQLFWLIYVNVSYEYKLNVSTWLCNNLCKFMNAIWVFNNLYIERNQIYVLATRVVDHYPYFINMVPTQTPAWSSFSSPPLNMCNQTFLPKGLCLNKGAFILYQSGYKGVDTWCWSVLN